VTPGGRFGSEIHEVLEQRVRATGEPGQPREVQLIQFPSEDALASFMGDERRGALASERDAAIERTEVLRVDLV
jgi:hypothetical protein